jgi:dihydropteroate synthase
MASDNIITQLLSGDKSVIMGIVNVTPDSFSDGGKYNTGDKAFRHAQALLEQGADILDIGGESTRPGADDVTVQEELDRTVGLIDALNREFQVPISIDTTKPQVMLAAVDAGATLINDVNALQTDGALDVAAQAGVHVCLMHRKGTAKSMQQSPQYDSVVLEVNEFLASRKSACIDKGIDENKIILDPGIGFGKSLQHNLQLLANLEQMKSELGSEILIGVSRKTLIGDLLGLEVDQRMSASVGLAVQAVINGAKIVRVHDVQATVDAVRSVEAVLAHQSNR